MHRILSSILIFLAAVACAINADAQQSPQPQRGVVRVKFQPEVARSIGRKAVAVRPGSSAVAGYSELNASLAKVKAVKITPVFPTAERNAALHAKYGLDRWYEVTFDESVDPRSARRIMAATPGVQTADIKVPMVLKDGFRGATTPAAPMGVRAAASTAPFNDPRLPQQWHYNNDGRMAGSITGGDINLFKAWQISTGSPDVLVAIIDGGIDVNHEDLAGRIWINEAEMSGQPGVDDDGNGYVDDVYGYNFCTLNGDVYAHSHGTHVAGTVGAINGNGKGVCGVAGGDGTPSSGVKMMSVQVFDSRQGVASDVGDFARALVYAADNGASIAQCSWGWAEPDYYEQDVVDAISYFTEAARTDKMIGGLCIFAAGNEGLTGNYYPACLDDVVSVASMTMGIAPASYSNFGPWVDVIAPGGLMDFNQAEGVLSTLPGNTYGYMQGTSQACPHVSGIAALVLSKYGSPTFTNEMLRTQLLTSVGDFYAYNPDVTGLYGSGYIDAYKALQMSGTGDAPAAVSDFALLPAQQSVTVEWVIPEAADNNVHHHLVYYSTSPFTSATLADAQVRVVDTKFNSSGESFSYELTGLEPLTTYYIAMKAVNRWGQESALSAVKSATTNAGPKMSIDKTVLKLTQTPAAMVGSDSFTIDNDADGLLRWSYAANTVSSTINSYSVAAASVTPYSGKLGAAKAPERHLVKTDEFMTGDYPLDFSYYSSVWAYIGDTDPSLPNSMAQLFTVDAKEYPDGFNLTNVYIEGDSQNPRAHDCTIEVYRGSAMMSRASRVLSCRPELFAYEYNVALSEQIYFAPGESFWIAVHFAPEDMETDMHYPLTLALHESMSPAAANSFMSTDMGKTWTHLAQALAGSVYENVASRATWAITPVSMNPDWSTLISLDPEQGQVAPRGKQTVTVSNDGQPLCNGTYKFNLSLSTNESGSSVHTLPVTLSVSGQKPQININRIIDFGSLLVGQQKTISVEIVNKGYGVFKGRYSLDPTKTSTNPQYSCKTYLINGIPARSKVAVDITFAPTEAGVQSGSIVFTAGDGTEFKIPVQGVATEPARIVVDPREVTVDGDLVVGGESRSVEFDIRNEGKYPLQYVFPKFSDEQIEGISADGTHRFGYTWSSNIGDDTTFAYDGGCTLQGATDVSKQFSDFNYFSKPIDLGFQFPFYGKTYDKVYISSFGALSFGTYTEGSIYGPIEATSSYIKDLGWISAYGYELNFAPSSRVEYAKHNGRFVVNFSNVLALIYDNDYRPISFRIELSPNGDVEIFYDDYNPYGLFDSGRTLFAGVVDPDCDDDLTVTSAHRAYAGSTLYSLVKSGSAVRIAAPMLNMVQTLTPATGIVNPGESAHITATVGATDEMYAGELVNNLAINSNDVATPTAFVSIKANVSGDLHPVVSMPTSVDFGKVYRTSASTLPLSISNMGKDALHVTAISISGSGFSYDFDLPADIPPGQSRDVVIAIDTAAKGAREGKISVTTSDGVVSATLIGEVIGCPGIELGYDAISETIPYGESRQMPLSITNTGDEPLQFAVTPGEFMQYFAPDDSEGEVSYIYSAAVDDPSVEFDWVNIESSGLGTQHTLSYYINHDFVTVDLPFTFPYYGKKYTRMYIYNTGFVSFSPHNDDAIWPEPPMEFPQGSTYTNVIAPYWGLHSMDQTKTAGTYYYLTADRAVVSWMEYGNSMNSGICFQLILNRDGSFKFQYKAEGEYAQLFAPFGLCGISTADGLDGIMLPARYIKLGNAVQFNPVSLLTLAPGRSTQADVSAVASAWAGTYNSVLNIATNVPTAAKIEIPVELTITGEAKVDYPDDITVEHTIGYRNTDLSDPIISTYYGMVAYYQKVDVRNLGSAKMDFDYIELESPVVKVYDDWLNEYYDMPVFPTLLYYGERYDAWTGSTVKGWLQYESSTPLTLAKDALQLAIPVTSNSPAFTDKGTYTAKLHFYAGSERVKTVTVDFVTTDIPVAVVDSDDRLNPNEVRVTNAANDLQTDRYVNISNYGAYTLKYDMYLDLTGVGETISTGGGNLPFSTVLAPDLSECSVAKAAYHPVTCDFGKSDNVLDVPLSIDYINAAYYPAMGSAAFVYGGDATAQCVTATTYTAPADGFNVASVYVGIHWGSIPVGSDLTVEIHSSAYPSDEDLVGYGKLSYTDAVADGAGPTVSLELIDLESPVYIAPNSQFSVVVVYPIGETYPVVLVKKEEAVVANRYLFYTSRGWVDIASALNDANGSLGYVNACIEKVKGTPWVTLAPDTPASGEVAPDATVQAKLHIDAGAAPLTTGNKAMLVIHTNDPSQPVINFPVILDKNAAPVVEAPDATIAVPEGQKATVKLKIYDPDGDDYQFAIVDNGRLSTIKSVTTATGTAINETGGAYAVKGGVEATAIIEIAPDYGDAGNYSLLIYANDLSGSEIMHKSTTEVRYAVERVNRAPVAKEIPEIKLCVGGNTGVMALADMFTDPDGDDLTFTFSLSAEGVVTPFIAADCVIFAADAVGTVTASVTATDPYGASATATLTIVVDEAEGIADTQIDETMAIYPNPATDFVNVTIGTDCRATIEIYTLGGALVKAVEADLTAGSPYRLDIRSLSAAPYLLRLTTPATRAALPLLKR